MAAPFRQTVAFDLETFLIERVRPAPVPVCLAWYDGERGAVIPHGENLLAWVERLLADPTIRIVNHNIAYDFACLLARYPHLGPAIFAAYEAGRITDTGIRQQLYFIAQRPSFDDRVPHYSLAGLVDLIFDADISAGKAEDAWRYRYGELYGVPFNQWPDAAVDYARDDAAWAWKCDDAQDRNAADKIRDDAFLAYADFCLTLTAARGMRADPAMVDKLEARWTAELERLRPRLIAAGLIAKGGTRKNPRWVKKDAPARERIAAAWAALHAREDAALADQWRAAGAASEIPNVPHTEIMLTDTAAKRVTKDPDREITPKDLSIDKAACVATGDELLLDRARYVLAEKILSTYVPPMRAACDGPITTRFNLASTMRTTSSAPGNKTGQVGTNLQNAPRDGGVRECLTARPGHVLLAADLAAAELHTLAEVCKRLVGYSTLGDLLNSGEDAHLYLASKLLGIGFDDAKARFRDGDPELKDARQRAKPGNFGFGGAMGWRKFIAYNLRQAQLYDKHGNPTVHAMIFTPAQAQALKRAWLEAYPEMQEYFDFGKRELGPEGTCTIELWPGGPLRRVKGLAMWANSQFQAPAAKGAKLGVCAVTRACHVGDLRRVHPVNFVHDEFVAEVEVSENLHADACRFAQILQESFNTMAPTYPTTVEPVLMTHYSKAAEPVFENGRLVPWSPRS